MPHWLTMLVLFGVVAVFSGFFGFAIGVDYEKQMAMEDMILRARLKEIEDEADEIARQMELDRIKEKAAGVVKKEVKSGRRKGDANNGGKRVA